MSGTIVFRTALDALSEAIHETPGELYSIDSRSELISGMIDARLSGMLVHERLDRTSSGKNALTILSFPEEIPDLLSESNHLMFIMFNPFVKWPRKRSSHGMPDPFKLISSAKKMKRRVLVYGSGTPVYFALTMLANLVERSPSLHYFIKDLSNRLVLSKGLLSKTGAILVIGVREK